MKQANISNLLINGSSVSSGLFDADQSLSRAHFAAELFQVGILAAAPPPS
nr:hypothetical protein [Chromobacterium sp. ASV5]